MNEHPSEIRAWADHHQSWSSGIVAFFHEAMAAFAKLQEIRFSAPWRTGQPCGR